MLLMVGSQFYLYYRTSMLHISLLNISKSLIWKGRWVLWRPQIIWRLGDPFINYIIFYIFISILRTCLLRSSSLLNSDSHFLVVYHYFQVSPVYLREILPISLRTIDVLRIKKCITFIFYNVLQS